VNTSDAEIIRLRNELEKKDAECSQRIAKYKKQADAELAQLKDIVR
jgi:hypothetical protein